MPPVNPPPNRLDAVKPMFSARAALLMLVAVIGGALAAAIVLPLWAPTLSESLLGPEPKAYWYLARSAGLAGYLLLWFSVAFGLLISNRLARAWPGGPAAVDLHQFASLVGIAYGLFHALILLGDRYLSYTLWQLVIPFGSADYRRVEVALGQIGFYLMAAVTLSFYVRQRIGYRAWRLLHYASFAVYSLVLAHGILAGTDASALPVQVMYIGTGAIVLFLTFYRILTAMNRPRPAARETA
ncbi:MAG: ferric reductase-like transmembrane domain-containing protein [Anaerolineae bacterium]|nr:ferric reductase-like transmembrane domain-containing protein [Anaerolineae bacterium]